MDFIEQAVSVRLSVFNSNIQRAKALAVYAETKYTDELPDLLGNLDRHNQFLDDLGMYSVVATISSLDEFIKNIATDALLGYLTNRWKPKCRPLISKIKVNNLYKITHLSTELLKMALEGEDINDPLNSLFINNIVYNSTKDINFQSFQDFNLILKDLTGIKLTESFKKAGISDKEIEDMRETLNSLSQKRHEYVHRMATYGTTPGGDHDAVLYSGPISDDQLNIVISIAERFCIELVNA